MKVEIYTDGACSGNPGPGGWAAILMAAGKEKELSGYAESSTNNRMELQAVIEALKALKVPCDVTVYSDSSYVVNAFVEKWIDNWKRNGWKNASKSPVSNSDQWMELDMLAGKHKVRWEKVKGHSDNPFNNRCDKLAVAQIKMNNGAGTAVAAEPKDPG
ncbi:MAG: ribonuclease HI [Saccharofermentanales bacterium]